MKRQKTDSFKPIMVALQRLSDKQLFVLIDRLEGKQKLQFPDRCRLLLAHNEMNERLWQREHANA